MGDVVKQSAEPERDTGRTGRPESEAPASPQAEAAGSAAAAARLAPSALQRLAPAQRHQAVLALQRTTGNAAVSRLLQRSGAAQRAPGDGDAPAPKDVKMSIAADKEADWWTPGWYEEFNVGHSWVMVEMAYGTNDSYGFWPANLGRGGGFDPTRPWQDVDGEVRHPDEAHRPTAKHTVAIDEPQLRKGIRYAVGKFSARYNLLRYNCTTFAREMFAAATGQTAPSGGLLIDDPNDLAKSISAKNRSKGLDPMEQSLPPKKASE